MYLVGFYLRYRHNGFPTGHAFLFDTTLSVDEKFLLPRPWTFFFTFPRRSVGELTKPFF